jgi:hypothetical protein
MKYKNQGLGIWLSGGVFFYNAKGSGFDPQHYKKYHFK